MRQAFINEEDEKTQAIKTEGPKNVDYSLIHISIPEIMSALHQTAISKIPDKSTVRVANSAISKDGKKLNSAGQHIISILPVEEGDDAKVEKEIAIKNLKEYVTWFVGPDLAEKVTNKVVLPLADTKADKNTELSGGSDAELSGTSNPKESIGSDIYVQSFRDFLFENYNISINEAGNPANDNLEKEDNIENNRGEGSETIGNGKDDGDSEPDEPEKPKKEASDDKPKDDGKEKANGYYIAYNLKVQGLKETSLKDAMKDFATNFFDNIKITASGLFGGSGEITGKDIRKGFHDLKHIDHKKLAENVEAYIKKKFPNIKDTEVKSRDSKTLFRELRQYPLTKEEKSSILGAAYCLWIKVKEEDRKKPFLNKKKIAEIIRKNIAAFRVGKKAAVTEDKIIKIENFKDTHDAQSDKNNAKRPSAADIATNINKFKDSANENKLEYKLGLALCKDLISKFKGIKLDKKASQEQENKQALEIFKSIENEFRKHEKDKSDFDWKPFEEFENRYSEYEAKLDLGESQSTISILDKSDVITSVLQLLFEDLDLADIVPEQIIEADDPKADGNDTQIPDDLKTEKTIDDLKTKWKDIATKILNGKKAKISLIEKDKVISGLNYSDKKELDSGFNKDKNFNYGLIVDFDPESTLEEAKQRSITKQIMNLLFEASDDDLEADDNDYGIGDRSGEDLDLDSPEIKKQIETKSKENAAEANGENVEQNENDITKAFDEFKKYVGLKDDAFGEIVTLEKEIEVKESIEYGIVDDLLLEKSNSQKDQDHITNDQAKDLISLIQKKTLKNIQNNKEEIEKKWGEPKKGQKDFKWPGKYQQQYDEFHKLIFDQSDENKTIEYINQSIHNKGDTAKLQKVVLTRFAAAIKQIEDPKEIEKMKITFYDADPETNEKLKDPLGEPIEIEKGTPINASEESQGLLEEYNKKLKDNTKKGFEFTGWNPEASTKADTDIDIVAKYKKIDEVKKDDENFVVFFNAPKDPSDPKSEVDTVLVDNEESQAVPKGGKAKRPDEKAIPKREGYVFKDWGSSEAELDNVTRNIDAVAQYVKEKSKVNAFVMPFAYYLKEKDDGEKKIKLTFKIPEDPEKPDKTKQLGEIVEVPPKTKAEPTDKQPEQINGYKFIGWEPKPEEVDKDSEIVGKYAKDVVPTGGEEDANQTQTEDIPQAEGTDLYIFPIESSKDFEETKDVGKD